MEKIIDFQKKGNVVRFYFGSNDNYWGDDWDDRPYEHNAGSVYSEFVSRIVDVAFPFDAVVLEPANDWRYGGNSPFSKQDMQRENVPCIIVIPQSIVEDDYLDSDNFSKYCSSKNVSRFFFNDPLENVLNANLGTILLNQSCGGTE